MQVQKNLNTSYVKVQSKVVIVISADIIYLNTSYVKVQCDLLYYDLDVYEFKYILC